MNKNLLKPFLKTCEAMNSILLGSVSFFTQGFGEKQ